MDALLAPGIGSKLLSQGKVLNDKRAVGLQYGSKRPDDQFENKLGRGPNLARHEIANNSGLYGFPRSTRVMRHLLGHWSPLRPQ